MMDLYSPIQGSTTQLTATVEPANATNQAVTWSSSFTPVATVNGTGLVTPVGPGSATITVTTVDGSHTATCTVTVRQMHIAAGGNHSLLVRDGTLLTAGLNDAGQLGRSYPSNQTSFGQAATNVRVAAGGDAHTLIVKINGELWVTGRNNHGQLGLGNTTDQYSPVQVTSISNVYWAAAGNYHSLLLNNLQGYAMGYNSSGQLGDGSTTERISPVRLSGGLTGLTTASAGAAHSLIANDHLRAFGYGLAGQLGDPTLANHDTPYYVPASSDPVVVAVAARGYSSFFVDTNGALWVMGDNSYGQLGLGDTTNRTTPTVVTLP